MAEQNYTVKLTRAEINEISEALATRQALLTFKGGLVTVPPSGAQAEFQKLDQDAKMERMAQIGVVEGLLHRIG
jgi:hypothetical protein